MNVHAGPVLSVFSVLLLIFPTTVSGQGSACSSVSKDPVVQAIACGTSASESNPGGVNEAIRKAAESGKPLPAREVNALIDQEANAMIVRAALPKASESSLTTLTVQDLNTMLMHNTP